jgi:hypothetical protein
MPSETAPSSENLTQGGNPPFPFLFLPVFQFFLYTLPLNESK